MYWIEFTESAKEDIARIKRAGPRVHEKFFSLLKELQEHPRRGTGHPKPLSGDRYGQWARRVTDKHRLVYLVLDEEMGVLVLSAWGHYDDK